MIQNVGFINNLLSFRPKTHRSAFFLNIPGKELGESQDTKKGGGRHSGGILTILKILHAFNLLKRRSVLSKRQYLRPKLTKDIRSAS